MPEHTHTHTHGSGKNRHGNGIRTPVQTSNAEKETKVSNSVMTMWTKLVGSRRISG